MHNDATSNGDRTMKRLNVIAILVALLVCWWSWRHYADASTQYSVTRAQLAAIERDVAEISQLRGHEQHVAEHKPPERDVIARINDAIQQSGLSPRTFASLAPEADTALATNKQFRRQTLRLNLHSMDLAQFGSFLSVWRESQTVWTITQIELTHSRDRSCEPCYDATLVLSAIYIQGIDA